MFNSPITEPVPSLHVIIPRWCTGQSVPDCGQAYSNQILPGWPAVLSLRPHCILQMAVQTHKKLIQIDIIPQPPDWYGEHIFV